jgi:hypothetical protein
METKKSPALRGFFVMSILLLWLWLVVFHFAFATVMRTLWAMVVELLART